ncbi:hypothetical protein CAPTEDRAFT_123067 [Capitella teleta]|uniref:HotDog ACOT-type domain-containing protein n=1 Tax=Capitella teleta TaxID=283909 RepID=R7TVU6_CAPTE|nr:hypothetical protein CAPTEDRAFT_123067 [Capitella teleta]|eukprot:ELT98028.1 hypothetical protein CAPTEDRAFT_123067 [Capitella teleta]
MELAQSQAELPSKSMIDSYEAAVIPLKSDKELRGKYVNSFNLVRYGRIMEDLDTMAVWISFSHNRTNGAEREYRSPLSFVTAMVDSIDIMPEALIPSQDITICGHVTWVGSTSVEVSMHVEQVQNGAIIPAVAAKFVMVARDPQKNRKAFVCPLEMHTDEEKSLFDAAACRKAIRQTEAEESLLRIPPSHDERLLIHDLFLQTLDESSATFKHPIKPAGSVWMEDTLLKNITICFPEERNLYGKIFGGYLMRQAFEIAWANACVYCKGRPSIVAVDDIIFKKPVEIGSLLYLSSQIVYTNGDHMLVKVHAEVVNAKSGQHETTNIFHYTFRSKMTIPPVIPKSYAEYMMYLDGKRHFGVKPDEKQ